MLCRQKRHCLYTSKSTRIGPKHFLRILSDAAVAALLQLPISYLKEELSRVVIHSKLKHMRCSSSCGCVQLDGYNICILFSFLL